MQFFLRSIAVILIILGFIEVVRKITFFCMGLNEHSNRYSLVVAPKNAEECEYLVRSAAEKVKWMEKDGNIKVICLSCENTEIEKICKNLKRQYPCLIVSKSEDLRYNVCSFE